MTESRIGRAVARATSAIETDTQITGITSTDARKSVWVYLFQFCVVRGFIGTAMVWSLYSLSTGLDNRDIWISLLSWSIGVLVPSPANLKANKYIYPIQNAPTTTTPTPHRRAWTASGMSASSVSSVRALSNHQIETKMKSQKYFKGVYDADPLPHPRFTYPWAIIVNTEKDTVQQVSCTALWYTYVWIFVYGLYHTEIKQTDAQ